MRWLSDEIALAAEPGGRTVETGTDEPIAAVLDRSVVDGVEWIRVQLGRGYAQDFVTHAWAPRVADISRGGRLVHVEPVYEPVDPDCPDGEPTVLDLDAMLPLQSLYCFGSRTLTFSAVQVRDEGSEESALVEGTPEWLSVGGNLVMYWLPERNELRSIRIYVDPAAQVDVPQHTWLEVTGQFDHPAARSCTRTSEYPEFAVANEAEAVQICRARFVVTAVRTLSEAEIPPLPPAGAPGPPPEITIAVTVREVRAPVATRDGASAVWTGTQLLVWGGWDARQDHSFRPLNDGAAYTPSTGRWRRIPPAPIAGRGQSLAAWTGSELLVWGGNRTETEDEPLLDGAAYERGHDDDAESTQPSDSGHPRSPPPRSRALLLSNAKGQRAIRSYGTLVRNRASGYANRRSLGRTEGPKPESRVRQFGDKWHFPTRQPPVDSANCWKTTVRGEIRALWGGRSWSGPKPVRSGPWWAFATPVDVAVAWPGPVASGGR